MISVSGKIWTEQKVNKNLVEKFKQDYGLEIFYQVNYFTKL